MYEEEDDWGVNDSGMAPGMGSDNSNQGQPANPNAQGSPNPNGDGTEDVQPVHFSKKKTGIIIIFFIVLVIIILLTVRSCSLQKKVTVTQNKEVTTEVQTTEDQGVVNGGDVSPENSEKVPSDSGSNTSLPEEVKVGDSEGSSQQTQQQEVSQPLVEGEVVKPVEETPTEDVPVSQSFEELAIMPALGEQWTSTGIVSGLYVYKVNNSYTYGVNILIPENNDAYIICTYFCPKKTYDALKLQDSVSVTYQKDTQGNISVYSISK